MRVSAGGALALVVLTLCVIVIAFGGGPLEVAVVLLVIGLPYLVIRAAVSAGTKR